MPRSVGVLVGAFLALVPATGCAELTQSEEPSPSPTSEELSPPSAEEQALDAYEGMWGVVVEQSRTTDPDYSELERYAEDDALALAEHGLGEESEEEVVARGEPVFSPEVIDRDEDAGTVELRDCMDATQWLREDAETGELVNDPPEEPIERRIDATVSNDGLAWRVSDLRIWEVGSC